MMNYQLKVLGIPRLERDGHSVLLDRRTAAVLSYLALEGATSRSKLAGLMWPDSLEATARNNLSQTLRRIRQNLQDTLIEGDDPLRLKPGLTVDAINLKLASFNADHDTTLTYTGTLLDQLEFDDSPEFATWLYAERERLDALRRQSLLEKSQQLESLGQFDRAAKLMRVLLSMDAVAESAHRRLMRLLYLAGDRPAALRAFEQCKQVLAEELGVTPLAETLELARLISAGEVALPVTPRDEVSLPVEVLQPPLLVGRERVWQQLQDAWQRGQFMILAGEPGVGKTRLAKEFAASHGDYLFMEGRPGDRVASLSTSIRNFRRLLAYKPDLVLEPWVTQALSRVLPELNTAEPAGDSEQFLLDAVMHLMRLDLGYCCCVYDDLQFADDTSINTGFYVISASFPMGQPGGVPRWIATVRPHELSPHTLDILRRGVDVGHAVWIDVPPLNEQDISELLGSLNLNAFTQGVTQGVVTALHKRTGGNPLFILETLRDLIETRQLKTPLPEQLPLSRKLISVITHRMQRLPAPAQRVAQAAAVLQSDFDPALIASILNMDALELIDIWETLESAHVFKDNRFSHDLLYEATRGMLSQAVSALLNKRAADVLAGQNANPARVAKHYLAAGDTSMAGYYLQKAADVAMNAGLHDEAQRLHMQAEHLRTQGA